MIVGTVTLISILFFGGVQELFFIDKLENGVRQYVEDKDRNKEILAELKASEAVFMEFDKGRKRKLKQLHAMNVDRALHREDLTEFFDARLKERVSFQEDVIDRWLAVGSKILPEEWEKMIDLSDEPVELDIGEAKKKEKAAYEKVNETINRTISEPDRQAQAIALIRNFQIRFDELENNIMAMNAQEKSLLANQHSSREEFLHHAKNMNNLRYTAFMAMVDLHFDMLEVTSEKEWANIMNAVNKLIQ